ncbi:TolC family protein, partial [Pantoea agglomerans]|uniref:TolC family protein n=1 Tax=Enterobacter agglomerans TaxID=549 RepID=UPI001F5C5ACD
TTGALQRAFDLASDSYRQGLSTFLEVLDAQRQLAQAEEQAMLEHEADQRSLRTVTLPTSRGTLLDRNGEALALSVPSRDV